MISSENGTVATMAVSGRSRSASTAGSPGAPSTSRAAPRVARILRMSTRGAPASCSGGRERPMAERMVTAAVDAEVNGADGCSAGPPLQRGRHRARERLLDEEPGQMVVIQVDVDVPEHRGAAAVGADLLCEIEQCDGGRGPL